MSLLIVTLVALVLGFVGSMPLAGPISVMVVSRGAEARFNEGLRLAMGSALAEGIYAAVAFAGFATLLVGHPSAVLGAKAITAVVLLVVGVQFARWKLKEPSGVVDKPARGAFRLGLTTSLLNPTLLVTWSAVTTAIYSRQSIDMHTWYAVPFGAGAASGIAGWNAVLLALMRRYHSKLPKVFLAWLVRGMGLLLIGVAIWTAVGLIRGR